MAGAVMRRAHALGEVRSFLLEEFNIEPVFYSSKISQRSSYSCRTVSFDCVLERRRRESVDVSLIFDIATVEVLVGVVTTLVKCSTWTHATFQFGCGGFGFRDESSELVFERRMFEVYYLHRSSPSLLCLDVSFGTNFPALAEALAGGVSRNSALKSLTLHTVQKSCHLADVESLEVPFTSASMISVKELVLHFPDCEPWNNCATVVNLVRWNTTLEKLMLCSTESRSRLKDVTYTWTSENHSRALQVRYFGTESFLLEGLKIEPLAAKSSLDYNPDGIHPLGPDVSTLHLGLLLDDSMIYCNRKLKPEDWADFFSKTILWVVTSVATMSARSTTLKHVQMSFEWDSQVNTMCSCRKLVELLTQEKLQEIMAGNEMRGNTSLETLEVGFWKLTRRAQHVGGATDEWHTSYGGPCLSNSTLSDEYVVNVRM